MNINTLLEHIGSTVTYKSVTISEDDALYGTPEESFAAGVNIKTILTAAGTDDKLVKQGILEMGDLKITVKSDCTIKEGDVITINGTDWEVIYVSTTLYLSDTLYKIAGLKKRLAGAV